MADAGRPLLIEKAASTTTHDHISEDGARALLERQNWARQMRLIFSPKDMIFPDGALNPDYFKPKQKSVMVRKWTPTERSKLIKGINKHGIGNWTAIRDEFLPAWEIGEIRIKTQRLMGRQSLVEYIEAQWKGDETIIEYEYARNKKIGLALNHWKGGVLVNDENGVVKQKLETDPLEPAYAAYLAYRSATPTPVEPEVISPVGQRVSVWFSDVKQYFSGLVTAPGPAEGKFLIIWDSDASDPSAQPDEVELPIKDKTMQSSNDERWCFEAELQAHTRRPMKAHFGQVLDLQGNIPLNSPLALAPGNPPPKKKKKRGRKSKKASYDSEDDDEY